MLILLTQISWEPERPVASVRGVRNVTERPWNEVIVKYYRFFRIIIVGTPYLPDLVWTLTSVS